MKVPSTLVDTYARTPVKPARGTPVVIQTPSRATPPAETEAAQISISEAARQLASSNDNNAAPVDLEKVKALRDKIGSGTYRVNPQVVASRLLNQLG